MSEIDWTDPTTCDEWTELPGTDGWYVARKHRTTVYAGSEIIVWEHASVEEASAEIASMVADHPRSAIGEALDEITEILAEITDVRSGHDVYRADTAVLRSAWAHAVALGVRLGILDPDPAGFDPGIESDRDLAEALIGLLDDCRDRGLGTEYAVDLARAVRRGERVRDLLLEAVR